MPRKTSVRTAFIRAIANEFSLTQKQVRCDVFTGKTDPGEWSPSAQVVIHTEGFIPDAIFGDMDAWSRIDDVVQAQGFNVFSEPINAAVIAVHAI